MAPLHHPLVPNARDTPTSIRKIHIQNLVDLLHACLLRGDLIRARRAWSILIRCREVDWKSRWRWGLALHPAAIPQGQAIPTSSASSGYSADQAGTELAQWLRTLRMTVGPEEKPAVLHALTLHLIQHEQYREALEELETYLTSYPYLLSGPLHIYAGMLAFYLAQPESLRPRTISGYGGDVQASGSGSGEGQSRTGTPTRTARAASSSADSSVSGQGGEGWISGLGLGAETEATAPAHDPPNPSLLRQARAWFVKALEIEQDAVAEHYINMIDSGNANPLSEVDDERDSVGQSDERVARFGGSLTAPSDSSNRSDSDGMHVEDDLDDGLDDEDEYWA